MIRVVNTNDFLPEAYQYVFEERPFTFFNKYYVICTGRRELYDSVHEQWLDSVIEGYQKYKAYHYESHDAKALSMLDSLENLINCEQNKNLYIAEDD